MTKQISRIIVLATFAGLVAAATGCKCVCKANRKAGLATIMCQPMDQDAASGEATTFKVKACGEELSYQWHFKRDGIEVPLSDEEHYAGIQKSELQVKNVDKSTLGLYWCEVRSTSDDGRPKWSQTRMASLGTFSGFNIASTNMAALLLQNPVRSSSGSASITCPAKCEGNTFAFTGVVVYDNNGLKYRPNQVVTKGTVKVSVGNTVINNTDYVMLWRVTRTDYCCATKVAGSATDREFPCDSSKAYTFTVYLDSAVCPADGTAVTMQLMPDTGWQ
jgi:hypothetical protein